MSHPSTIPEAHVRVAAMMPEWQGDKDVGAINGDSLTTARTVSYRVLNLNLSLAHPLDTSNYRLVDLSLYGSSQSVPCKSKRRAHHVSVLTR